MATNFLQARIEQGKSEILADVREGVVPVVPASFEELHDYVDANEYGGLTEDGFAEMFLSREEWLAFCSSVQNAIHLWIIEGGIA